MTERRQFPPLKHWRDIRDKVWAILALVLAIVAIGKPDMQAAQATEGIVKWVSEDMRRSTFSNEKLSDMMVACMNDGIFLWQDPHTDSDYAAFCNVVELGKVGR